MADLGSSLFNPLAMSSPDLYAQQLAIARQQALGQALLQQGAQGGDYRQPYSGIAAMGNELLGAYLLKRGDARTAALAQQFYGAPAPQAAPSAAPVATPAPVGGGAAPAAASPVPPGVTPMQGGTPQAVGPAPTNAGPSSGLVPGSGADRLYSSDLFPKIPGVSPTVAMTMLYGGNPQDRQTYMKAYFDSVALTPDQKNLMAAAGGDYNKYLSYMEALANKSTSVVGRQGGVIIGPNGPVGIPNAQGGVAVPLANGQFGYTLAPGAAGALAQGSYWRGAGEGLTVPATGYDANLNPTATNRTTMAGQAGPANAAVFGNPYGPGGAPAPNLAPAPSTGLQSTAPGPRVPAPPMADGTTGTGNVPARSMGAPTPAPTGATNVPGPLAPAPPIGAEAYRTKQYGAAGTDAADTFEADQAGGGTATRLSVLRNMQGLLARGAQPGTSEWLNALRDQAISWATATHMNIDPNDPQVLNHILSKFMSQYTARAAQSFGLETDAGRELSRLANPNMEMPAATLREVIPYIQATEMGTGAKAIALRQWLGDPTKGDTPQSMRNFQQFWSTTYSPKIPQFMMMNPDQQVGYLKDPRAFPTQASRDAFQRQVRAIAPYIRAIPQ